MTPAEREKLAGYMGAVLGMLTERHGRNVKFMITARVIPTEIEETRDPEVMGNVLLVGNERDLPLIHDILGDLIEQGLGEG
jgi:hypothetical protein